MGEGIGTVSAQQQGQAPEQPTDVLIDRAVAALAQTLGGPLGPDEVGLTSRLVHAYQRRTRPPTEPVPVLCRPDRTDPDGHSARVAAAYRIALTHGPDPSRRIADAAGVPHTTVVGWVREARRRGHLPPGQRGRATA